MKVNINDMTDRERIVMTKEQLQSYTDAGKVILCEDFIKNVYETKVDYPEVIEVEEVLGG